MKAFIKIWEIEIELKRLPYTDQSRLYRSDNLLILEATDGRIYTVAKESDFILEFESAQEKHQAELERDRYYNRCSRYRSAYTNAEYTYGMTRSEFEHACPFDHFK